MTEPVLCYISGIWAYFTTQKLEDQWGDDWNDAPYEHNAGSPYEWNEFKDKPKWEIIVIGFSAEANAPCDGRLNSPYSVEQINEKRVPWLVPDQWGLVFPPIMAGTTISEFKKTIKDAGGIIWIKEE